MSVSIALDPKFLDNTVDISRFTPFADISDMRSVINLLFIKGVYQYSFSSLHNNIFVRV